MKFQKDLVMFNLNKLKMLKKFWNKKIMKYKEQLFKYNNSQIEIKESNNYNLQFV